jgi:glutamyl-tRNA synthetase
MNAVRVRFAPSPTGYLHIGGARSALFNYLYARKTGGTFILRIEDTDVERSTEDATQQILDSMKWLGLSWDEGPYFQSKRLDLYRKYALLLLETGSIYKCFCSKEKLEAQRLQAQQEKKDFLYDGCCRNLSLNEADEKEKSGEPFVLRFKVPASGDTVWNDAVAGEVRFENARLGDFVIARPDGLPTYNFCVVVDDIDMGITDVIRGADHISNTPRQVLIYEALKTPLPRFAHVPVILGTDRSKLSKRHGAASVMEYAEQGFLPEALFNFLALLGWSPGNDEEILSKERLVESFDLSGVGKANTVFDREKLLWLNGMYIRSMPREEIVRRILDFMPSRGIDPARHDHAWLEGIISLVIERGRTLVELIDQLTYFLNDEISYEEKGIEKISKGGDPAAILEMAHKALSGVDDFSLPSLEEAMRQLVEEQNIGFGKIAQPVRLALTGGLASPGLFEVIHFLGKERTLDRIRKAVAFFKNRKTG